jgi:hypothetical protein
MAVRMLRRALGRNDLRASDLSTLKNSRLYRSALVQRLLATSPVATHLLEDLYRHVFARVLRPQAEAEAANLAARLDDFTSRFPAALEHAGDESPVFLLAAGWRSGSTLLQRVLMSNGEFMIWGEPFARAGITALLASQFRVFTADWPPQDYFVANQGNDLSAAWIANSYPDPAQLIAAHRAFFIQLLVTPAKGLGRSRWGFKEVRLGGSHALYLKLLFPKARFVFLVRDPYACYASFRHYIKSDFHAWPERPIRWAGEFGRLWRELALDLERVAPRVDALWLKYEDYVTDPALHEKLCAHVDADLRPPRELSLIPSAGQIGASHTARAENRLLWYERRALKRALGDAGVRFGYAH